MPQADQAKLFTKFFRADNSTTRKVFGTGLGLFITRHFVEAHGGEIWATSREGEGSTFSFTLPVWDGAGMSGDTHVEKDVAVSG